MSKAIKVEIEEYVLMPTHRLKEYFELILESNYDSLSEAGQEVLIDTYIGCIQHNYDAKNQLFPVRDWKPKR